MLKAQAIKFGHKKAEPNDPSPNYNEHIDEFYLRYCILQGF